MSRLRTYAPMSRESKKRRAEIAAEGPVHAHVRQRSGGFCEVTLDGRRCTKLARDQHHVVKRSQGGATTPENLIDICRDHHDRCDWPLHRGRLFIEYLGGESFGCRIGYAGSKFTPSSVGRAP